MTNKTQDCGAARIQTGQYQTRMGQHVSPKSTETGLLSSDIYGAFVQEEGMLCLSPLF